MRKYVGTSLDEAHPSSPPAKTVPIEELATVFVTSEMPEHPVEHLFDGRDGADAPRWVAHQPGQQTVLLAFDAPVSLHQVTVEINERDTPRTQELDMSVSTNGGSTYHEVVRQEFTFSPPATITERETWRLNIEPITHLRLRIKPDKAGGPSRATMTALVLVPSPEAR